MNLWTARQKAEAEYKTYTQRDNVERLTIYIQRVIL